jgi:hypothetical protein
MELFADPFSHCANGIYIGGTKVCLPWLFFLANAHKQTHPGSSSLFLFLNLFPSFHFSWLCYKRKSITDRPAFVSRDNTVRLFKRFGRRRRCSSREERDGVRFSREEVQNVLRYWYSRKQPWNATVLGTRGGVRRISHRARHVIERGNKSL